MNEKHFFGQIPLVAGRSPWRLGQAPGVTCEPTPEGGQRCSDGTYLPPGCAQGSSKTVQAQAPGGFPVVPVAIAAAAVVGAGALLLAGGRMGATELETNYPGQTGRLQDLAKKITDERAADAYNFQLLTQTGARRLALVDAQGKAEAALAQQQKIWETSHRNADELAAAQAASDKIGQEIGQAQADIDSYRSFVNTNAQNISQFREEADGIIASLPAEWQTQAHQIIDPCWAPGRSMGAPRSQMVRLSRF
jgi:hypothetical protein